MKKLRYDLLLILGLLLRRFLDGYNRKTLQAIDSTKVML